MRASTTIRCAKRSASPGSAAGSPVDLGRDGQTRRARRRQQLLDARPAQRRGRCVGGARSASAPRSPRCATRPPRCASPHPERGRVAARRRGLHGHRRRVVGDEIVQLAGDAQSFVGEPGPRTPGRPLGPSRLPVAAGPPHQRTPTSHTATTPSVPAAQSTAVSPRCRRSPGICTSSNTTSGRRSAARRAASAPLAASPTTAMSGAASSTTRRPARTTDWSSATSTVIGFVIGTR